MNAKGMKMGLALGAIASMSFGSAVISSGNIQLGITDFGNLGVVNGDFHANGIGTQFINGVGLTYTGIGDGTYPGCVCEGFGVAGNGISGNAAEDIVNSGGHSNLNLVSFTSTATTAVSTVTIGGLPDMLIRQDYHPSSNSALYENLVSITNNGASAISDLRYTRVMDWDVPPTEFREFVTIGGLAAANLLYSDDNGFSNANPFGIRNPLTAGTANTNFTDVGASDHGALFDFGFGSLGAGETLQFKIFYGASPDEASAFGALNDVGAELYSFGQNSASTDGSLLGTPATFIFAFSGVGGTVVPPAVPEPSSLGLMGLGLAGAAWAARRRKK